ncbi:MAG TPA: hypothetical protein VHW23_26895 [Kofleriaceae bacterium]|nr:hypothetical protein [Kofleriaceae bacterium]
MAGSAGAQPAPDAQPPAAPAADQPPAQPAPDAQPPAAPAEPTPPPAPAAKKADAPAVTTKWSTTFYGFAEGDLIMDSIQGPGEALGNGALARPANGATAATFASQHSQFITSARNSRLGFRVSAPTVSDIKPSANLEFDFNGNQPPGITEASTYVNATMRIRHAYLKFETPVVDVLVGQYWQLFGWQPASQPGSIQFQGLPGFLSSRAPQLRIGKVIKAGDVSVDVEVAATRPAQRASGYPDGVGGLKVAYDKLKAHRIVGSSGTADDSAFIGASVIGRKFSLAELKATPVDTLSANGYGFGANALIPIIPATKESHANALTVEGEFITGGAISDLYTGLSGGVALPTTVPGTGMTPAPAFTPNIDNGLVEYKVGAGNVVTVHPVHWQSFGVGGQYFLPPSGNVALVVNYSHLTSDNAHAFNTAARVFEKQDYLDANLFFDITPAVRLVGGFAWVQQTYVDGVQAKDYRGQFGGLFIF